MKKSLFFLVLFFISFSAFLFSDNIRGDVVKVIEISDANTSAVVEFSMSIEDIFAVKIAKDSEFIRGFEVEFAVPQGLRRYSNTFAFDIYKQVSPAVKSGIGTYYGTKYHSFILPEAVKFHIQIPYEERLSDQNTPYTTVINETVSYNDTPLMVTILPMMKGFPSSLYNSTFGVKVYPLLKDVGTLSYIINIPEGLSSSMASVSIDQKATSWADSETGINLTEGNHSITVDVPGGKPVTRTFSIEKGETTNLEIDIEKLESFAVFEAPENTIVYIDGEKLNLGPDRRIKIEPGMHTVLFKIDDYKISKNFNILPGKDCKISLFLDIFVEEN